MILILTLILLAGALVLVGSQVSQRTLPPPFGPASNGLIAADVDGAIVLQEADGTNRHQLDLPFEGISGVSFSRDGTKLAAWSDLGLVVANVDGSNASEIPADTSFVDPSKIQWSPDGQHVAFSANGDQLYVADLAARRVDSLGVSRRRARIRRGRRMDAWHIDATEKAPFTCASATATAAASAC